MTTGSTFHDDPQGYALALENAKEKAPVTVQHGDNSKCPEVQAGIWKRCLGHQTDRRGR